MKPYHVTLLDKLKSQRRNGEYCDIEIQVEDKLFYGHKCILSAASPCLESHIKKAEESIYSTHILHRSQIKLGGISSNGFRSVMDFIYSGEAGINNENVNDISNASMILDIPTLIKECVNYKSKQLVVTSYNMILPRTSHTENSSPVIVNVADESYSESSNNGSNMYEMANSAMAEPDYMKTESDGNGSDISQTKMMETAMVNEYSSSDTTISAATTSKDIPECSVNSFVQSFDAMSKDPSALPTLLPLKNSMMSDNQEWQDINLALSQNVKSEKNVYTEEIDEQGNPIWRCGICNKVFNKLSYLKYVHIRLHDGNRPHNCATCGKTFATKGNLLQHHKSHLARNGILPFKCRYCKKGFSLKGNCLKHEKTHTKPYRCEFCLKSFSVKANLLQHIAKIHENIADQATVGSQCSKCHIVFSEAFGEDYLSHKCGVFLEMETSIPAVDANMSSSEKNEDL